MGIWEFVQLKIDDVETKCIEFNVEHKLKEITINLICPISEVIEMKPRPEMSYKFEIEYIDNGKPVKLEYNPFLMSKYRDWVKGTDSFEFKIYI